MDPQTAPENVLSSVVEQGLCVRCGACLAVCPHDALSADDRLFPMLGDPDGCNSCEMCMSVCPGHQVDLPGLSREVVGADFDFANIFGSVRKVWAASAVDRDVRRSGSSGGVITALVVHLLKTERIEAALVVGSDDESPTRAVPLLATDREQVVRAAQSKYTVVSPLTVLRRPASLSRRLAVVGLPCQVHGLRKWEALDGKLRERVRLVVGLVCNMTLEKEAGTSLLRRAGISPEDVTRLEYRGGDWPGGIRVGLRDGREVPLHAGDIRDGAFNFLKYLFYPPRCLMCVDFSNDLADLSVADPWIRGPDGYRFPHNTSIVLTRTDRGEEAFERAVREGGLEAEEISLSLLAEQFGAGYRAKRRGASVRLGRRVRKGKPVPDYGVEIPAPTRSDKLRELREDLLRLTGRYAVLRRPTTALAFSWPGRAFVRLKQIRRRFRR